MKPSISIIIPVLNESGNINDTIGNLARLSTKEAFEIVVIDAAPDAATLKSIHPDGLSHLPIKTGVSDKGRGIQMNRGAELASGRVLLFLHADTLLPEGSFDAMLSAFQNKRIVAGAFDLGIRSGRRGYRIIESVANLRSRLTRIPYGDQAIFFRKDYFHRIGGFSKIPIMEDVDIMRRIKKRGDAIEIIGKRVQTDPRRWEKEGLVFGTLRNWVLMILYLVGVPPRKLGRYYNNRVRGGYKGDTRVRG